MSNREVAKALQAEGYFSLKTTVYYIEYRVRRLRERGLPQISLCPVAIVRSRTLRRNVPLQLRSEATPRFISRNAFALRPSAAPNLRRK